MCLLKHEGFIYWSRSSRSRGWSCNQCHSPSLKLLGWRVASWDMGHERNSISGSTYKERDGPCLASLTRVVRRSRSQADMSQHSLICRQSTKKAPNSREQ